MGSICIGSIMVPIFGVSRGSARGMKTILGETDEFMFSCANCCYSGVASALVMQGIGGALCMFASITRALCRQQLIHGRCSGILNCTKLIDLDITSSFCFLSGMAGGAICSLVSGTWTLLIHKSYATEVSLYAFLIGYLMCRIAMPWPPACLLSYYVAYAENPNSTRFDLTIPLRIEEHHRFRAA